MQLKKEAIEFQQQLSKKNIDFLEYVEKTPGCLKRSNFKILELKNDLFKLQPWPTFINKKTKQTFQDAGVKLFKLIKSIPKRIFNNDVQKMSDYFEVPLEQVKAQMEGVTDDHIDSLLGRGDFIVSPSGLKCLEYNVAASLGGWQIPIWEILYLNNPIIANFLKSYGVKTKNENLLALFLEHVTSSCLSKIPGCTSEINIAVLAKVSEPNLEKRMKSYLEMLLGEILNRKKSNIKGNILVGTYQQLELIDNALFFLGKRVHSVTEMDLGAISTEVRKAFRAGNIRLFNGPVGQLLSHKLNLALLSDYENPGVFTAEEKKIIDTHVPWTRKITAGKTTYKEEKIAQLEHFMIANREKLVIKPSEEYGGKGVCVGPKSSEKEWEEAINTAFKEKNWVVQEYVKPSVGYYQEGQEGYEIHDMTWGFFIFGYRYTGAWVRVMPQENSKGVINCHQGASVSIIFETEE